MSAVLSEDFNSIAAGAALSTSNTGASFVSPNPPLATTRAYEGSRGAQFTTSASQCYLYYTLTPRGALFARMLIWCDAFPDANTYIATMQGLTDRACDLRVNTTGTVTVRNFNTAANTSSVPLALSAWNRIEWGASRNAGQRLRLYLGSNVAGSTPSYDSGLTTYTQDVDFAQIKFGMATNATWDFTFDLLAADDSAWPAMPVTNLTVSAGAVHETLVVGHQTEVNASAIDGDGNYTYAWSIPSGPNTSTSQFFDPTSAFTLFTPTAVGAYTLRCTATDGQGRTGHDDTTVQSLPDQRITWARSILVAA